MADKEYYQEEQGVLLGILLWQTKSPIMSDKKSYHGGQEVLPWRTRSITMADKESYHVGQEVLPCRTRSLTMADKKSYHGGQGVGRSCAPGSSAVHVLYHGHLETEDRGLMDTALSL